MTTVNQGMCVEEIERVVAQSVANAIEAIAIYETKTNLARKSMSQTERQEEKVAENASNKRKWESNHNGSLSQQNKGHKVPRAHAACPINKKAYAGSLPLCNQCKSHHSGLCTIKSLRHYKSECSIVKFHKHVDVIHGRMMASKPKTMQEAIEIATKLRNKKISTLVECQTENKKSNIQKGTGASQKATCYECGNQGHYRRDCPEQKNQNHENQIKSTKARRVVHAFGGGETEQDLNKFEDEIES
nr:hypothetical protein [Tanacetum cinerariifolium]